MVTQIEVTNTGGGWEIRTRDEKGVSRQISFVAGRSKRDTLGLAKMLQMDRYYGVPVLAQA